MIHHRSDSHTSSSAYFHHVNKPDVQLTIYAESGHYSTKDQKYFDENVSLVDVLQKDVQNGIYDHSASPFMNLILLETLDNETKGILHNGVTSGSIPLPKINNTLLSQLRYKSIRCVPYGIERANKGDSVPNFEKNFFDKKKINDIFLFKYDDEFPIKDSAISHMSIHGHQGELIKLSARIYAMHGELADHKESLKMFHKDSNKTESRLMDFVRTIHSMDNSGMEDEKKMRVWMTPEFITCLACSICSSSHVDAYNQTIINTTYDANGESLRLLSAYGDIQSPSMKKILFSLGARLLVEKNQSTVDIIGNLSLMTGYGVPPLYKTMRLNSMYGFLDRKDQEGSLMPMIKSLSIENRDAFLHGILHQSVYTMSLRANCDETMRFAVRMMYVANELMSHHTLPDWADALSGRGKQNPTKYIMNNRHLITS